MYCCTSVLVPVLRVVKLGSSPFQLPVMPFEPPAPETIVKMGPMVLAAVLY